MSQSRTKLKLTICFIFLTLIMQFVVLPSAESVTYTYDDANRLIREEDGTGPVIEYTYDNEGNLIQKNVTGVITYTVTPSAGSGGSISPSTPQTVNYNQTIQFTVTPDTGYHIVSVTGCGGTLVDNTYTTGPITSDCTVTASFAVNTFTVTPSAGANGTITPSTPQTVNYNDTVQFTVTPDTGYSIASVTGCNGTLVGNTYTAGPITADCTVIATFIQTLFQESDPAVTYPVGTWNVFNNSSCNGGALKYACQTGAKASFSFSGTGLKWICAKDYRLGMARVCLDGGCLSNLIDLYSPTTQFQIILQKTGLTPGSHTVTIEVSGDKNPSASNCCVVIDAFEVIP
jgi:YD repeat-containing protein